MAMRVNGACLAAASTWVAMAMVSGCSEPSLAPCAIRCEDRCAFGFTCREDGFCHAEGDDELCAPACVGCVRGGPYNHVFVSSELYSMAELGGLEGADANCARLAGAAGLPGEFRAYLSTTAVHAGSRLVTPDGARASGWIRTDGRPFATSIDELLGGGIRYPPVLDENGDPARSEWVATGSDQYGQLAMPIRTAGDWTQNTDFYSGTPFSTTWSWGAQKFASAGTAAHIYCLGIDHDRPLPIEPVAGRRAFLSEATFLPSNLAAADEICQAEGDLLAISEVRALLSTSETPAASRFDLDGPTWVRLDGIPWLESAAELASGRTLTSLNVDWRQQYIVFPSRVWTGSTTPDSTVGPNCSDWASSTGEAITGVPTRSGTTFFHQDTRPCNAPLPLYCLER